MTKIFDTREAGRHAGRPHGSRRARTVVRQSNTLSTRRCHHPLIEGDQGLRAHSGFLSQAQWIAPEVYHQSRNGPFRTG
jgi:hypothetical protein